MSPIGDLVYLSSNADIVVESSIGDMQFRAAHELGTLIRQRRRELGLSQAELAARVGASRQWVVDLEHGKPGLALGLALRAAEALGVTLRFETAAQPLSTEMGVVPIDLDAIVAAARRPAAKDPPRAHRSSPKRAR